MLRKVVGISLAAMIGLSLALPVVAQDAPSDGGALADRLEKVRRSLASEAVDQNSRIPAAPASGSYVGGNARVVAFNDSSNESAVPQSPVPAPLDESVAPLPGREPQRLRPADAPSSGWPQGLPRNVAAAPSAALREPVLVEQQEASPPQSSRRRPPAPVDEASPRIATRGTYVPPRPIFAPVLDGVAPGAAAVGRAAVAGDALLFARKSPLLRVETTGPRVTVLGKEAAFSVRIQNLGDVAAEGVAVQIRVPEWAEVTATQPSRGTAQRSEAMAGGSPLVWQLDRVDGRGNEALLLKLVPRKSQRFDLGVSWTFTPAVSQTEIEVQEPKLEVAISGPHDVLFLESKAYHLTITNPGTGSAEQVTLQLMPVDGGSQPTLTQSLGTIAPGRTRSLAIELTARHAGPNRIRAVVTADGGLRAEAAQEVNVRRAALKVDAVAPVVKYAGTPAKYVVHVRNPGDATAVRVAVEAMLPAGAQHVAAFNGGNVSADGSKITWSLDAVPAGDERTLEFSATLHSPGANLLRVVAGAAGDLADASTATTDVEAVADLKLEVADPSGPIAVGEEVIYEVRIHNRGTKAATDVEAVAFFSDGVEPIRAQGAIARVASGQVAFDPIPSVGAGSEVVLKIAARASRPGTHRFRAEVRCKAAGAHLVSEETTLFYQPTGGEPASQRRAGGPPEPTPLDAGARPLKP